MPDLVIKLNSNETSSSKLGGCYQLPDNAGNPNSYLAGSEQFKITDIEVNWIRRVILNLFSKLFF